MEQLLRSVKCGLAASKKLLLLLLDGWHVGMTRSASFFLLLSATGLSFVHTASAPSKNEAQPQKIIA